jgi:mRNA interferase MazF
MARGKIVLVPFPYDDFSRSKVRPALCLTDPIGPYERVIVAFITSNMKSPILASDLPLSGFGLDRSSRIRLHRLMTISRARIQREIGFISPELLSSARVKLACLLHI